MSNNTQPAPAPGLGEGEIVWCTKQDGGYGEFPPWPAVVHSSSADKPTVDIDYLGERSCDVVDRQDLRSFLPHLASLRRSPCKNRRIKWEAGIIEGIKREVEKAGLDANAVIFGKKERGWDNRMQRLEIELPGLLKFTPIAIDVVVPFSGTIHTKQHVDKKRKALKSKNPTKRQKQKKQDVHTAPRKVHKQSKGATMAFRKGSKKLNETITAFDIASSSCFIKEEDVETKEEDGQWKAATIYRLKKDPERVVLFYSEDEVEGTGSDRYSLIDGILQDTDGGEIQWRRRQLAVDTTEWKRLTALFMQQRQQFVHNQQHLFRAFVGDKVAAKWDKSTETGPSGSNAASFQALSKMAVPTVPAGEEIRSYQSEGVRWLLSKHFSGAGMILADEMGLGKTMQTVLFMSAVSKNSGTNKTGLRIPHLPHLVVAPLSVVATWVRELARWWPGSRVVVLHGGDRKSIKQERLKMRSFDVCVTTPETMRSEKGWLSSGNNRWHCMIFDEAHKAKNERSDVSKAARRCRCLNRLLLTGTPVQNNAREVYALLNLLFPEAFNTSSAFDEAFDLNAAGGAKVDTDLLAKLAAALEPIMLRRTKAQIDLDIPKKTQQLVYVPLMPQQLFWYKALLTQTLPTFAPAPASSHAATTYSSPNPTLPNKRALLNLAMQLRKCCNHPYMFEAAEPSPYLIGEHLVRASGKLTLLDELLGTIVGSGNAARAGAAGGGEGGDDMDYEYAHNTPAVRNSKGHRGCERGGRGKKGGSTRSGKCVIFSNFTATLDILDEYLRLRHFSFLRLDGSTPPLQRQVDVEDFQRPGSPWQIFLVSTMAGGLGLTLTAADAVVLFDSHYNPQVDKQAQDRVHRIGQTRPVTVYRLICEGTIEEGIAARAGRKLFLDAAVIGRAGGGGAVGDTAGKADLKQDELMSMVMHGVADLVEQEDDGEEEGDGNGAGVGGASRAKSKASFAFMTLGEMIQRSERREARLRARVEQQSKASSDVVEETGVEGGSNKMQALLRKRSSSCKLFRGVNYEKIKATKKKTSYSDGDGESRIAEAWKETEQEEEGKRKAREPAQIRMTTISVKGIGHVGQVPEKVAVECNMSLDALRVPSNNFSLFISERAGAAARQQQLQQHQKPSQLQPHLMKVLAAEWKELPALEREIYDSKAARDRQRYLTEVSHVVSNFGVSTIRTEFDGGTQVLSDSSHGRPWEYRSSCVCCGGGPVRKLPSQSKRKGTGKKGKAAIADNPLLQCPRCPNVLHMDCVSAVPGAAANPRGDKLLHCGHHKCAVCLKPASNCGGALLCCVSCPNSYCGEHRPPGSEVTRRCGWAEQLGFRASSTTIYFQCGSCNQ